MKNILLFILLLFLAPVICGFQFIGGRPPSSGGGYSDITFWLNFEANDTSDPYAMGASECSTGDDTGSFNGGATIGSSTPTAAVGTYYLEASAGYDLIQFDLDDNDVDLSDCVIGFWWRYDGSWGANRAIFQAKDTSTGYEVKVLTRSSTGNLYMEYQDSGGVDQILGSDAPISVDTWVFIEIILDQTGSVRKIQVDDSDHLSDTGAFTAITGVDYAQIGLLDGNAISCQVDNFMISNDSSRDLYALRNETSKPAGACE